MKKTGSSAGFIFAHLLILLGLCGLSQADTSTIDSLTNRERGYPFIEMGIASYYLQNPDLEVGTRGASTAPLGKINSNGWTPMYNLGIGYHFYNNNNNWFTRLFSPENEVLLKGSYFNSKKNNSQGNLGEGNVWYIDGSGLAYTAPNIYNFNLETKSTFTDLGLLYRWEKQLSHSAMMLIPLLGIGYQNFETTYDYTVKYEGIENPYTDKENYQVKTNYMGFIAGSKLQGTLSPRFKIFSSLIIHLLHASAKLTADQNADIEDDLPIDKKSVNASDTKDLTYRAILSAGLEYKPFNLRSFSPIFQLEGGIDHWDYNPKIVPPNNESSPAIHVVGTTQNNAFVRLGITVPIN